MSPPRSPDDLLLAGLGPHHRRLLLLHPRPGDRTVNQKLAWMIILATIPVGLVGAVVEHEFRALFAKPVRAAIFLIINGLILFAGEKFRRRAAPPRQARQQIAAGAGRGRRAAPMRADGTARSAGRRHASGQRARPPQESPAAVEPTTRLAAVGYLQALLIGVGADPGAAGRHQPGRRGRWWPACSAACPARTRPGSRSCSSTPVILAAGVLKLPDLTGPARQRHPRPDHASAASCPASAPTCRSGSWSSTSRPAR